MAASESAEAAKRRWNARLLDLRFVIAVMFAIFGVLVTVSGFTASNEEIAMAAGINISLWTGIGLLLLSAIFTGWLLKAPPEVPEGHDEPDDEETPPHAFGDENPAA